LVSIAGGEFEIVAGGIGEAGEEEKVEPEENWMPP
jgi:hypothetical protein